MIKKTGAGKATRNIATNGKLYNTIEIGFKIAFQFFIKKPLFLTVMIFVVVISGVASFLLLRVEFLPKTDLGEINISLIQKDGTSIKKSEKTAAILNALIAEVKEVEYAITRAGGDASDLYYQADPDDRKEIIHLKAVLKDGNRENVFIIAEKIKKKLEPFLIAGSSSQVFHYSCISGPLHKYLRGDQKCTMI